MKNSYKHTKAKTRKNLYTPENIKIISDALNEQKAIIRSGVEKSVSITDENIKMGPVHNVSLLPYLSCPSRCKSTCACDCYAAKIALNKSRGKSSLDAWAKNQAIWNDTPDKYFSDIDGYLTKVEKSMSTGKKSKGVVDGVSFFRFHVSGDIPNYEYFLSMVKIANDHKNIRFMAFTKRYEIVNRFLENGVLPVNLKIIFSGWDGITIDNPHNLPTTDIILPGSPEPSDGHICNDSCFECGKCGCGCWNAQPGEKIYFYLH